MFIMLRYVSPAWTLTCNSLDLCFRGFIVWTFLFRSQNVLYFYCDDEWAYYLMLRSELGQTNIVIRCYTWAMRIDDMAYCILVAAAVLEGLRKITTLPIEYIQCWCCYFYILYMYIAYSVCYGSYESSSLLLWIFFGLLYLICYWLCYDVMVSNQTVVACFWTAPTLVLWFRVPLGILIYVCVILFCVVLSGRDLWKCG